MFNNLNAELARNGLKPADIAKLLNVSLKTAHNKLAGKTEFTLSEIKKIASLFPNCTISELFEENGESA